MSLSVKFNGVELNQYIDVLQGFTPFSGPDWSPEVLSDAGIRRGTDFSYTTYKQRTIPMPFTVLEGLGDKLDALQRVLNVEEPQELIFENAPDRVFYAVPMNDLNFDDYECFGEGEITWLIPDGFAHSITETTFEAEENDDGILEATIINNGTESVPISYEITHNHENGYIGIVSEHGVMQYGCIDEVDTEEREKSQTLTNYKTGTAISAGMTTGGIVTEPAKIPVNGTFKTVTVAGHDCLALNNVGSGSYWHGAAKRLTIPADSNGEVGAVNFKVQARVWYETGQVSQTGLLELVVGDEDGNLLCDIHFAKSNTANNTATCIYKLQGMGDANNDVCKTSFEPNYKNPLNVDGGIIYIEKKGELFTFYTGVKKYSVRAPKLAEKKALTVTVFLGQYGTRGAGNLITRMYFRELSFRSDSVSYTYDIPNRYQEGDVLTIDGETTKTYVNGVPSLGDEVKGTKPFKAPPGETKVQFYYSDFCDPPPTIKARIREAYL